MGDYRKSERRDADEFVAAVLDVRKCSMDGDESSGEVGSDYQRVRLEDEGDEGDIENMGDEGLLSEGDISYAIELELEI